MQYYVMTLSCNLGLLFFKMRDDTVPSDVTTVSNSISVSKIKDLDRSKESFY